MNSMIGTKAIVVQLTRTGTRTILGHVTQTSMTKKKVTHVTIKGIVQHETVTGVPLPIEQNQGEPVTLEMIPLRPRHTRLITVELLEWTDETINRIPKATAERMIHWSDETVDLVSKANGK